MNNNYISSNICSQFRKLKFHFIIYKTAMIPKLHITSYFTINSDYSSIEYCKLWMNTYIFKLARKYNYAVLRGKCIFFCVEICYYEVAGRFALVPSFWYNCTQISNALVWLKPCVYIWLCNWMVQIFNHNECIIENMYWFSLHIRLE